MNYGSGQMTDAPDNWAAHIRSGASVGCPAYSRFQRPEPHIKESAAAGGAALSFMWGGLFQAAVAQQGVY